jgi:hypothetical protein
MQEAKIPMYWKELGKNTSNNDIITVRKNSYDIRRITFDAGYRQDQVTTPDENQMTATGIKLLKKRTAKEI